MNHPASILIISPDAKFTKEIGKVLSDIGPRIETVPTSRDGLKKAREHGFDMVITDFRLQDFSCPVLIRRILVKSPQADILVGLPTENLYRQKELLDCGADDIFEIPLKTEELHLKVNKLLKERSFLKSCGLVGKSIQLKRIAESAIQVAPTNITVKDGEPIIIGGLIQEKKERKEILILRFLKR